MGNAFCLSQTSTHGCPRAFGLLTDTPDPAASQQKSIPRSPGGWQCEVWGPARPGEGHGPGGRRFPVSSPSRGRGTPSGPPVRAALMPPTRPRPRGSSTPQRPPPKTTTCGLGPQHRNFEKTPRPAAGVSVNIRRPPCLPHHHQSTGSWMRRSFLGGRTTPLMDCLNHPLSTGIRNVGGAAAGEHGAERPQSKPEV